MTCESLADMATLSVSQSGIQGISAEEGTPEDLAHVSFQTGIPGSKRRRTKRNGPPVLQFVTATNLAQFKDESTKKSIRSQAMIHYRHHTSKNKADRNNSSNVRRVSVSHPKRVLSPMTNKQMGHSARRRHGLLGTDPGQLKAGHQGSDSQRSSPGARSRSILLNPRRSQRSPSQKRYYQTSSISRPKQKKPAQVVQDGYFNIREAIGLRIVKAAMARVHRIGDSVDPFDAFPQWQNPKLSSMYLQRSCLRGFSSDGTLQKWLPALLSHPHILLSSSALASTWLDMHEGIPGDSKRTAMVKAEVIGMVNERLNDPATRYSEATLMVILHLFAGEMWACNERAIRIHERGISRFIESIGGMDNFSNRTVAEVAAATCYHANIFCETSPGPPLNNWNPTLELDADATTIPESPVFCLNLQFTTIKEGVYCKPYTIALLNQMRILTDLLLSPDPGINGLGMSDSHATTHSSSTGFNRMMKISEISAQVAGLPSAHTPDHSASSDWVYEACRIASLIYTTAIVMRIPFAVAAGPSYGFVSLENPVYPDHSKTSSLVESLYEVLQRTDLANMWNDMPGVLYWVTAVGAAAARTPAALDTTSQARPRKEAYAVWVRRCLIMHATRVMVVLIFQHPVPVIMAQKKILRVQELVRTA